MPKGVYERRPLRQRFDERWIRDETTGCHVWTAGCTGKGYGNISFKDRPLLAHRVAWEWANGPIPDGLFVCHTCDNRRCVNVAHMFLGTQADNMADKVAKGRQARGDTHGFRVGGGVHAPRGERHHSARFTDAQIADMRADHATGGLSKADVARKYGCTPAYAGKVLRGRNRR